jgi:flavin-dependent thymidylate synthase
MISKSTDLIGQHNAPEGMAESRVDKAYDNIIVKLLDYPEEERFKLLVYKAVMATRGSGVGDVDYDESVVEDAFSGGLNQCLEWANVTFEITGVTRGFTHQLVRTRKASFSQQSFRATNMSPDGAGLPNVRMPQIIADHPDKRVQDKWKASANLSGETYKWLVDTNIPYQDARTVLPIGVETYVIACYPLKVFIDTYNYRGCYMFYPETVAVFHKMKEALTDECPWLDPFILISCERTAKVHGTHPDGRRISAAKYEHVCTYQGWEKVEGHCPLPWAKDDSRSWKSRRFKS